MTQAVLVNTFISRKSTGIARRGLVLCLLLAAMMLLVVACGGGAGTGAAIQPQSQARLVCTQECRDRGQCGTSLDGRIFVLGREFEPAVDAHDRLFPQETVVTINGGEIRTLQPIRPEPAGGEPFPHTFYHVTTIDGSKSAWISSWCVVPQPT
jgi:hypothetical protein